MFNRPVLRLIEYLKSLQANDKFIDKFKNLEGANSYILAKAQEQLIIDYSNGALNRLNPTYYDEIFDKELDSSFGDFIDVFGNYYDLKVGDEFCGAIDYASVRNFGNTSTDRHYYICVKNDWSKIYIINARELRDACLRKEISFMHGKDGKFLGEKCYGNIDNSQNKMLYVVTVLNKENR